MHSHRCDMSTNTTAIEYQTLKRGTVTKQCPNYVKMRMSIHIKILVRVISIVDL